jgi:hypothetical protein
MVNAPIEFIQSPDENRIIIIIAGCKPRAGTIEHNILDYVVSQMKMARLCYRQT